MKKFHKNCIHGLTYSKEREELTFDQEDRNGYPNGLYKNFLLTYCCKCGNLIYKVEIK